MADADTEPIRERRPLEDDELRTLLDAADAHAERVGEPTGTRDRMIIYGLAFLGVRASTLAHMTREWIDFQSRSVRVPAYQDCRAGRDGGPCSECKKRLDLLRDGSTMSRREVYADIQKPPEDSIWSSFQDPTDTIAGQGASLRARADRFNRYADRPGLSRSLLKSIVQDHDGMWFPKSGSGHRPIPVKDDTTWSLLQRFFEYHDELMITRQTVGNVLRDVARDSDLTRRVEPHEMRHTYGTRLAAMDFSEHEIADAMGHATTQQARDYVRLAGKRLDDAFQDKWEGL